MKRSIVWAKLFARPVRAMWKDPNTATSTRRATTPFSLKMATAINGRSATVIPAYAKCALEFGHDLRQGHKFLVAANGFPKTAGRVNLLSCFNTFLMLAPDKQQS